MKTETLIKCLKELQGARYNTQDVAGKNHANADKILNLIFELGKNKTTFIESEKKEIGILLGGAIKPIKFSIEHVACRYRTRLESAVLRKRSALEFLFNEYGQFPAGDSLLATKFAENNLKESVDLLDDIIEKWADVEDSDEGQSDRETQLSGLPKSHTWWFN
ncbi:hypothetical protein EVAR_95820_1 [Eumeta japonica]|uniref:Uncharacterized protein n=1 Tax=Eumeta variegata TaxID=151549 RepID=A0A4C1W1I5_EUMVA|nr:hypothetical protein EVAR_95820_1 [Eumeta japonica]